MHHDVDARRENANREQTLGQILQTVATFEAERGHGSRQYDRNLQLGQSMLQVQTCLNHRIGSVSYHDGRLLGQKRFYGSQNFNAPGIGHLQAVNIHQRNDAHVGVGKPQESKVAINLAVEVRYSAALLRVSLLDGSTRRDNIDHLHLVIPLVVGKRAAGLFSIRSQKVPVHPEKSLWNKAAYSGHSTCRSMSRRWQESERAN